jgi:3-methyladenine DNA glycosylase/8-oxoguanine DNA glycosylase
MPPETLNAVASPQPSSGGILLRLPFPIDLELTVISHGWAQLAPWRWEVSEGALARSERIGGDLGAITVRQHEPTAVFIGNDGFDDIARSEIACRVRRWLSVDWDPAEAMVALGDERALIARGGGRLLRCSSFYEDFVKTVLTINAAWSSTCRMAAALVAEPGGGAFPGPEEILDYGETRLRERAKLGFRAATIVAGTRRMLDDGIIDPSGEGRPDYEYLIGLKGIGPYAAAHCRLLLHDFSRIPVDSVVTAYLRDRHTSDPQSFATSRAAWGAYLALGYRLGRLRDKLGAVSSDRPPSRVGTD